MRKLLTALASLALVTAATAFDIPRTIDASQPLAPALEIQQNNRYSILWTVKVQGQLANLGGLTGVCYYATSNTVAGTVRAACEIVSASNGTFRSVFTPTDLNTNGTFMYGVGVMTNGQATIFEQGVLTLTPDPFAAPGSGRTLMTTNETDPVFLASVAGAITSGDVSSWNAGGTDGVSATTFNTHTGLTAIAAHSGLGTASAWPSNAFATAAQGATADTAVQPATLAAHTNLGVASGPHGMGTAAAWPSNTFLQPSATAIVARAGSAGTNLNSAFATAAEGTLAGTAVQPAAIAGMVTNKQPQVQFGSVTGSVFYVPVVSDQLSTVAQVQVTGTLTPDATGYYTNGTPQGGTNAYYRVGNVGGFPRIETPSGPYYIAYDSGYYQIWLKSNDISNVIGVYTGGMSGLMTGTAVVATAPDRILTNTAAITNWQSAIDRSTNLAEQAAFAADTTATGNRNLAQFGATNMRYWSTSDTTNEVTYFTRKVTGTNCATWTVLGTNWNLFFR